MKPETSSSLCIFNMEIDYTACVFGLGLIGIKINPARGYHGSVRRNSFCDDAALDLGRNVFVK